MAKSLKRIDKIKLLVHQNAEKYCICIVIEKQLLKKQEENILKNILMLGQEKKYIRNLCFDKNSIKMRLKNVNNSEAEWAEARVRKEAEKKANKAKYLEYEAEHECVVCGSKYIAHHPFAKYCSKTCARKNTRSRDNQNRYKNITVDKGITLPKLAKRDQNQCQICGLFVNWEDFIETDKTKICGDMYPSIDHIMPISLGGMHSWNNVQLAHRGCNTKKKNKYIG